MTQSAVVIGAHEAWRSGDVLGLRVRGALSLPDIDDLQLAVRATVIAEGRCFLLADLTAMAGLEPTARRRIADWSQGKEDQVEAVAVFGCSFAMRTLITLTLNAIKLLGRQQSETVHLRDEAAARRWIDARRAAMTPR